jgi:uncharacterized membrane protein YbaN (DUF454 family)
MNSEYSDPPEFDGYNASPLQRYTLLTLGWIFVGLGAIGVFLPVVPTTPFLIVALWAFSRSSQRFHHWLYTHRWYGPYLVAWDQHRVIPIQAKVMAITFMALGWCIFTFFVAQGWVWPAVIGAVEVMVAIYVGSKPSKVPEQA